uniref:Large ribosomal subunit protein uL23c n=1 Tax=Chlorodesmis fastigiata TaxID=189431 RepID=A0A2P0QHI1_CHLFS|nr:ribosomal protein L23 [Chlorodesmis fastigiata]ARO74216.1 ribosomal protein L23 [Chlorodesmis fastigiata]
MVNKFNEVQWNKNIFNFLKRPIITDKTIKFVEQKKYVFDVNLELTKKQIKKIFEEYYQNPVKSIKTFRKNRKNKKNPNKRVILRFLKKISIVKN